MPLLSDYALRRKFAWFFRDLARDARLLEVGAGPGRLRDRAVRAGWRDYTTLDLAGPADIVGDIRNWRALGLAPASFDVVIAFEVVEHVPCFQECFDLLRTGGWFWVTTPVPERDGVLLRLEHLGLNQPRTSPHRHLVDLRRATLFEIIEIRRVLGIAQWGRLRKPGA